MDPVASVPTSPSAILSSGIPTSPYFTGLGWPTVYRDLFPFLRSRFDTFGYSPFMPEGSFKAEEARLDALKEWTTSNQKREEARLKVEGHLESSIVSRASSVAKFWEKSLTLIDYQNQIAKAQLAKARDRDPVLDQLIARKAAADAERAEHERDLTAKAFTRKAYADAERAEAEVALVKCQHKKVEKEKEKLDWEIQVVQSERAKFDSERAKFDAEREKFLAEKAKFEVEAALLAAQAASASMPSKAEKEVMITALGEMEPCVSGYPWEDNPNEGGFKCTGGSHFKTYEEARAMTKKKRTKA